MGQQNIYACEVDGVRVALHTKDNPTDADWRAALEWTRGKVAANPGGVTRYLIVSDGGAPTPKQRAEFNAVVGKHQVRTALLTQSALVRGVLTAMSWFVPNMRAFSMSDLERAFAFLEIPADAHGKYREAVQTLRQQAQNHANAA